MSKACPLAVLAHMTSSHQRPLGGGTVCFFKPHLETGPPCFASPSSTLYLACHGQPEFISIWQPGDLGLASRLSRQEGAAGGTAGREHPRLSEGDEEGCCPPKGRGEANSPLWYLPLLNKPLCSLNYKKQGGTRMATGFGLVRLLTFGRQLASRFCPSQPAQAEEGRNEDTKGH